MRHLLALPFFLLSTFGFSQGDWLDQPLWNIGYSQHIISAPVAFSSTTGQIYNWEMEQNITGTYSVAHMSIDYYSSNFYGHFDPANSWATTIFPLVTYRLIKDIDADSVTQRVGGMTIDPIRIGFGTWINSSLGVYGGVQYAWANAYATKLVKDEFNENNPGKFRTTPVIGGHCFGVNGTVVYDLSNDILLTYTLMLDRVRNSKGINKGFSIGNHIKAHYRLGDILYLFANIEHHFMRMNEVQNGVKGELSLMFRNLFRNYNITARRGSIFEINAGICIPVDWF